MLTCKADPRLLVPGRLVGSTDGQPWVVTSSVRTKDGTSVRLADLMGEPAPAGLRFDPISLRLSRFAAMMRRLAYNKEFDAYVKDSIREAGLPVDQSMNWAKYLYTIMVPRLDTQDDELIDEAIHFIIIRELVERKKLSPQNPHGFYQTIGDFRWGGKNHPGQTEALPLEKQVTEFLKKSFIFRADEANKYLKRVLKGLRKGISEEDLVPLSPGGVGEEESYSPIDYLEHPSEGREFREAEDTAELGDYSLRRKNALVGKFTEGLYHWLLEQKRTPEGRKRYPYAPSQYVRLLSLMYNHAKEYGTKPSLAEIEGKWKTLQQEVGGHKRLGHEDFVKLFSLFPEALETYVRTVLHLPPEEHHILPNIVRLLVREGEQRRQKRLEESDKDRESRRGGPEPEEQQPPAEAAPEGKTSAKQIEMPRCATCQTGKEVSRCPGCEDSYCSLCVKDHFANNPGHERT
jgi:hypothetical protein